MKSHFNVIRSGLIAVLLAVALTCQAAVGATIYVDDSATGDNDGSSWENAYPDLQGALAAAAYDDEIRVGQGTYKPSTGSDRMVSFQLIDGVSLCGGYAGVGAADPNAHDTTQYATILSGDIGTPDDNSDNSYHVVKGSYTDSNTILDGFTITGGNANSTSHDDKFGAGLFSYSGSLTVTNCIFTGNIADKSGGGIYLNLSSATVTNCTFSGNEAKDGGGMCNNNSSSPRITNCTFSDNSAAEQGGGMQNYSNSSPTVTNCTFSGNEANAGGGIYNGQSSPTVINCILWGDTPDSIYDDMSNSTVTYSDVEGGMGQSWFGTGCIDAEPLFVNAAGGDLCLASWLSPCVDTGDNTAPELPPTDLAGNPRVEDGDRDGTAVVDMGAFEFQDRRVHNITQDLWYETIQKAIDGANGGDEIEASPGTYAEAINFLGKPIMVRSASGDPNDTTIDGTGHYHVVLCVNGEGADTILEGFTITGGNADGSDPHDRGGGMYNDQSSPTVTHCIFSGNSAIYGGGMLNIDCTPMVTGCTFQNNITSSDSYGGGGGMYNHNSSPVVTDCIFSGNLGKSWGGGGMFNAVGSNPTLINCTFSNNSAVENGGGIYNWNGTMPVLIKCNFSGNSATDFGGGMFNEGSSPTLTNCTFSDNSANNGGGMGNIDGSSPTLTGCTFSDNAADDYGAGGGMCNDQSSPTVTHCTFSGNSADGAGGGMLNWTSSPTVANCIFSGNSTTFYGGGMLNWDNSNPTVIHCSFSGNSADIGGGVFNDTSSPTVTNCTFNGNTADGGGGMYNSSSNPMVTNCCFNSNSVNYGGGGMYNYTNSDPNLTNCTFSGNSAESGGGIRNNTNSDPNLTNCILWGNTALNGPQICNEETCSALVTYSDVQGGWPGDGNIDADPKFVDPYNSDPNERDFHLYYGSPCIDAGDSAVLMDMMIGLDLDGKDRFIDSENIANTGVGPVTFVDMGAYEFSCSVLPGDNNCDGVVNLLDLCILANHWLQSTSPD